MSHSGKRSHSSTGSCKGSCHVGGHSFNIFRNTGSGKYHHGVSGISHQGYCHQDAYKSSHGSHNVHRVSQYRAPSAHGGSGGRGISISKHSSSTHGSCPRSGQAEQSHGAQRKFGGHSSWKKSGVINFNEKETMQLLNSRLASYLEKVCSLENENNQLERNIREWYDRNQPSAFPDSSNFFRTIQELKSQVSSATVENARVVLHIDNARLAADDFKNKYELELQLHNTIEADMKGLRRALEGLNREICDLEARVQNLQEELQQMKRTHEEEVNSLRAQLGQRVTVELNAAPSVDLNRILSEIRHQYENLMERNMREVESMFLQRTQELNQQVTSGSEQLQSVQTEVIDLKRSVQTLEIELESQLSMKSALQCTLAEIEGGFSSQLSQLQGLINNVESQLEKIRSDLEHHNHEYKILMDQTTHLEREIATYKQLLDGHVLKISPHHKCSPDNWPCSTEQVLKFNPSEN
ncbi:keratin, type I cytoskeletal 19-like isoform X2 [Pelobates fuscus]|uniref:keratin, type I cytoskeletal 19-like isoform X2 n=1 Tax=Pelobates fuscus TaxID=191477 RepID=UPI002FE484F7